MNSKINQHINDTIALIEQQMIRRIVDGDHDSKVRELAMKVVNLETLKTKGVA